MVQVSPQPSTILATTATTTPTPKPTATNTKLPTATVTPSPEPTPTATIPLIPVLYPAPYGSEIPFDFEVIKPENVHKLQQVYMLGQGALNTVSWSPDQIHFYLLGYYGVYLYSSVTWKLLLQVPSAYGFEGRQDMSPKAAFSADGRYFGVAGSNGLLVYEVATLKQVLALPAKEQYRDIVFFHSGERFATCTIDGKVNVFEIDGELALAEFQVEEAPASDCQKLSVSSNGSRLVWVSGKKVFNWDFATGEVGKNPEFDNIYRLVISADGSKIAATHPANPYANTTIWDSASGIVISTMWGQPISDYSPETDLLAVYKFATALFTSKCDGPVFIWDLGKQKLVREIAGSMGYSSAIFGPKGDTITATADFCEGIKDYSKTRYIRSWDLSTGKIIAQYPGKFTEKDGISNIGNLDPMYEFDMNGNFQILGLTENYGDGSDILTDLSLWDHPDTDPIMPLEDANPLPPVPTAKAFIFSDSYLDWAMEYTPAPVDVISPDGKFRYLFRPDIDRSKFQLIRIEDNQLIAEFKYGLAATFTPDSNLFIVFRKIVNWQGVAFAEFWDLQKLERARLINLMIDWPLDVDLISGGRLLRTRSTDHTVRFWGIIPEK